MFFAPRPEVSSRRFWRWFAGEAAGLANALEALARGEADGSCAIDRLNRRIRSIDPRLEADVVRDADGLCRLSLTGEAPGLAHLLASAPRLAGWRIQAHHAGAPAPRIPFLRAPRPSLDEHALPVMGGWDAFEPA